MRKLNLLKLLIGKQELGKECGDNKNKRYLNVKYLLLNNDENERL